MSPEKEAILIKTYPALFRQTSLPKEESCMYFGVDTGDGWFDLIDKLSAKLTGFMLENKGCKVEYSQIKEKFGLLRVYIDVTGNGILYNGAEEIVTAAERASASICEECGSREASTTKIRGWLVTLCPRHQQERKHERQTI